jgi:hypothetical protein
MSESDPYLTFQVNDDTIQVDSRMGVGDPQVLEIVAPNGERLGVILGQDGGIHLIGWEEDGTSVDLVVRQPCSHPNCHQLGHNYEFDLTRYRDES